MEQLEQFLMIEFERKAYYSPKELAAILGVHRTTIDRYIREGTLRAVKLSARTYRIPLGAVLRLVSPEEIPPVQHPSPEQSEPYPGIVASGRPILLAIGYPG